MPSSCRFPPLREGNRTRVRFPLRARETLRRGASIALVFVNCVPAIGIISVFAVRFKHSPHPNPPRGRGGSRGSSPVHGGGWEGGHVEKPTQRHLPIAEPEFITPPSCRSIRGRFFAGVLARSVAEQGIPASMRARRSRSQPALRWERGRPARHANRARKNLPLQVKEGGRFMNSERAIGITTPRSASARAGCRDSPGAHAPPTPTSR